jgi:hypothetical protein
VLSFFIYSESNSPSIFSVTTVYFEANFIFGTLIPNFFNTSEIYLKFSPGYFLNPKKKF